MSLYLKFPQKESKGQSFIIKNNSLFLFNSDEKVIVFKIFFLLMFSYRFLIYLNPVSLTNMKPIETSCRGPFTKLTFTQTHSKRIFQFHQEYQVHHLLNPYSFFCRNCYCIEEKNRLIRVLQLFLEYCVYSKHLSL